MPSFAFPVLQSSGMGGLGISGMGAALYNAIQGGLKTENDLYDLQNRVRTDPFVVPAQAAQADAARLDANRQSIYGQGTIDELLRLQGQPVTSMPTAMQQPTAAYGMMLPQPGDSPGNYVDQMLQLRPPTIGTWQPWGN